MTAGAIPSSSNSNTFIRRCSSAGFFVAFSAARNTSRSSLLRNSPLINPKNHKNQRRANPKDSGYNSIEAYQTERLERAKSEAELEGPLCPRATDVCVPIE